MKIARIISAICMALLTLYCSYYLWRVFKNGGDLIILSFIWVKLSSVLIYGVYYQSKLSNKETSGERRWKGLKLMGLSRRIGSFVADCIAVGFLWVIGSILIASFLYLSEGIRLIKPVEAIYGHWTYWFNHAFDFGLFTYVTIYFLYHFFFEYFKNSTPGKMINNCGIITKDFTKPKIYQIFIKNIFLFIPINEFLYYFTGVMLNEKISGLRTVELEKHTTDNYNAIIKNTKIHSSIEDFGKR